MTQSFRTIDQSHEPKIDFWTRLNFWACYMHRHYVTKTQYGPYGNPSDVQFMEKVHKRMLEQSKRVGQAPVLEVPVVDATKLSDVDFQKIYLHSNTPVLLKGMAKDWPAVKNWTPDYFKEKYPNEMVPVRLRANENNLEALRYVDLPISKVVDNIHEGGFYSTGHIEDIFNNNPELRNDLRMEVLQRYLCSRKGSKISSTQIFLSGTGTRSGLHCTGAPNLFVMVYGYKEWTLVDPKYTPWIYPITRKDMFYSGTPVDWKKSPEEIEKDGHALFNYIPRYVAPLEPGDILFSPHWWWHSVNTNSPAIGVATRTLNKFIYGNKVYSVMWVLSSEFRRLLMHFLKTGWGSDSSSGAKLAFEKEFIEKVTRG